MSEPQQETTPAETENPQDLDFNVNQQPLPESTKKSATSAVPVTQKSK